MKTHKLRDIPCVPGFEHAGMRLNCKELREAAEAVAPATLPHTVRRGTPEDIAKADWARRGGERFAALRLMEGGAR
jgi:hypothetical protein